MLWLLTGTPGSGKSLWMVKEILAQLNKPDDKQRKIYCNINNLKFEGIEQPPDDWRQCEKGSIIIYDEAQRFEAFAKETRANQNEVGKDLSVHRHGGYDIWLITQSPKLLNDFVKENVNTHIHLYRPRNKHTVRVYYWSYAVNNLTKSNFKLADDERVWRFDPSLYQYYKSAEVHTHEKRISQRTVSTLITAVGIFAVLGYFIFNGVASGSDMTTKTPTQAVEPQTATNLPASTQTLQEVPFTPQQMEIERVAMVISTDKSCTAKNAYGHTIDLPYADCMRYSRKPKLIQPSYLPKDLPSHLPQPTQTQPLDTTALQSLDVA